ncbi:MAG: hypothetical protein K9N21_10420 [Deltaproteobacteria bacterium]|nr:hypothetical protein [Deltaproteobacteria bacterium]
MTKNDEYILDLLHDAQDKLWEVIELLDEACKDNPHAQAYLVNQLRVHADSEHGGFLSHDLTIDDLIREYEGG